MLKKQTFIKLADKQPERKKEWPHGKLSGCIEYVLETKTPLFIPNTTNEDVFGIKKEEHNSYAFYSYEDLSDDHKDAKQIKPIVPGSEIRGMFRSYYEMLTDSCISRINDEVSIIKRIGKNKIEEKNNITKKIDGYDNKKCNDNNGICKACNLFGTVNGNFMIASRLRFTDLTPIANSSWYEDVCHLKPLGTPKMKGEIQEIGRKFYYHNINLKDKDYKDNEAKKLGCTIIPVKKDIEFAGKVYFDSLSNDELNELIYLINCGEQINSNAIEHGYKLGRGKPLGLGSVILKISSIKLRKTILHDGTVKIDEQPYTNYASPKFIKENDFKSVTKIHPNNNASIKSNYKGSHNSKGKYHNNHGKQH